MTSSSFFHSFLLHFFILSVLLFHHVISRIGLRCYSKLRVSVFSSFSVQSFNVPAFVSVSVIVKVCMLSDFVHFYCGCVSGSVYCICTCVFVCIMYCVCVCLCVSVSEFCSNCECVCLSENYCLFLYMAVSL